MEGSDPWVEVGGDWGILINADCLAELNNMLNYINFSVSIPPIVAKFGDHMVKGNTRNLF